jgi:uncharacterized protein
MKSKILSIIEVVVVFILMIYLFRFVNSTPLAWDIIDFFGGRLFPGYIALLIASLILYYFRVCNQTKDPISKKLKYQLDVITAGFFPFFVLSVLLTWIDWKQWAGAVLISILEIGLLFWFAQMAKDRPSWPSTSIIGGFFLITTAFQNSTRFASVFTDIISVYLFVALSEEILFRGYIQSRLNSVFGRPKRFFNIHWGCGLIITSVLFGFWHLGWSLDMLAWPHVLWTIFAGLCLGFVREKSESVIAPAFLHGIMNYGPQAILFYLFMT